MSLKGGSGISTTNVAPFHAVSRNGFGVICLYMLGGKQRHTQVKSLSHTSAQLAGDIVTLETLRYIGRGVLGVLYLLLTGKMNRYCAVLY